MSSPSKTSTLAKSLGASFLVAGALTGLWHFVYKPFVNPSSREEEEDSHPIKPKNLKSNPVKPKSFSNQSLHLSPILKEMGDKDLEEVAKTSLFEVSTALVFMGVPGSGRATMVDTLRPWLGAWGFQSRHLTLANVLGQGYASGGYSQDQVDALFESYKDLTSVDPAAYVKRVCDRAWERSRSPTVFMIADLSTEAEIRYLKQRFGKVVVFHLVTSSSAPGLPFADKVIHNTGSKDDLIETTRRYFASSLLPALKDLTSLDSIQKDLISRSIKNAETGEVYYDTNSLFANPSTLFSCMYIFSSLLKTMDMGSKIDAIVAVSSKAVPLTTCLSYMLGKPNPSLLYHTHIHEDLLPYRVEWAEGDSAGGHFAVGWAPHLLQEGSRVLLVDDILATGRRAEAVGSLAESLGYEVVSLCVLFTLRPEETTTLDFPLISLLHEDQMKL